MTGDDGPARFIEKALAGDANFFILFLFFIFIFILFFIFIFYFYFLFLFLFLFLFFGFNLFFFCMWQEMIGEQDTSRKRWQAMLIN